jgi:hypothetical protein
VTVIGTRIVVLSAIDEPASFHDEARFQGACASCGKTKGAWEAHHVLQKQTCRRFHAPLYSPDNAMRLCSKSPDACHERHTTAQERVRAKCLRDETIAFVARWLGPGPAYVYLSAQYAGSDPRIEALVHLPESDL